MVKASTSSMKLKGKMLSGVLDLFPNPDSAVPSVELIPDMNNEPPIVANRDASIDGDEGETCPATQSMNVEHFHNNNTKLLSECKRIWSDSETNTRSQVKRLKTNTSYYSGTETESMMAVEEGPSGKKVNYFFHRIIENNKPGSRRYQIPSTSQIKILNMGEDVSPWIQRWCKTKAGETHVPRGGQEVNPHGTALEKQFPSIAAMAMMKKALSGLNPTGCRKTNSLFVWNADDLR
ncbi:PREDICTED: F-box protein At2g16365-like isoform X2 [Camelina sativa]|nr:PREDICTED: F-box protein At2g16365-like isoform X2 [Camelina sativa]